MINKEKMKFETCTKLKRKILENISLSIDNLIEVLDSIKDKNGITCEMCVPDKYRIGVNASINEYLKDNITMNDIYYIFKYQENICNMAESIMSFEYLIMKFYTMNGFIDPKSGIFDDSISSICDNIVYIFDMITSYTNDVIYYDENDAAYFYDKFKTDSEELIEYFIYKVENIYKLNNHLKEIFEMVVKDIDTYLDEVEMI